jgi:hypothetical protein
MNKIALASVKKPVYLAKFDNYLKSPKKIWEFSI